MDLMKSVVVPVLGGTAGFIAARYLGNMWAMKDWGSSDPKVQKTAAAALGIPLTFLLARQMGPGNIVAKNSGAIVLGMGLAAAEAWLRDTPLLGGSPAAAAVTEDAIMPADTMPGAAPTEAILPGEMTVEEGETSGDGMSAYYSTPLEGMGDDYYTAGMLGAADPSDQASVESALDRMESRGGDVAAVSTIIPTGMARIAPSMPQFAPVTEPFVNRGGRAHAGGMFARNLFSGMMGS
jgi:hypothetical protein